MGFRGLKTFFPGEDTLVGGVCEVTPSLALLESRSEIEDEWRFDPSQLGARRSSNLCSVVKES